MEHTSRTCSYGSGSGELEDIYMLGIPPSLPPSLHTCTHLPTLLLLPLLPLFTLTVLTLFFTLLTFFYSPYSPSYLSSLPSSTAPTLPKVLTNPLYSPHLPFQPS